MPSKNISGFYAFVKFCRSLISNYFSKCINNGDGWTFTMKVTVIISESCHSLGDCLRDIDAKGVLRSDFVLLEPGVISNVSLLPLLKKHK